MGQTHCAFLKIYVVGVTLNVTLSMIISIADVFRQARSIAKNSKTYAVASDNIFVHSRVESFLSH